MTKQFPAQPEPHNPDESLRPNDTPDLSPSKDSIGDQPETLAAFGMSGEPTIIKPTEPAEPAHQATSHEHEAKHEPTPSTNAAEKPKKAKRSKRKPRPHKLTLREILLRASLVVIFAVLIVSSIFRGFNLFEFYEILSGKQQITAKYREYACQSPGVEGEVDAIPLSKSFESPMLTESMLGQNLVTNGDLTLVDPKNAEKPSGFLQSYYGKIDSKFSFTTDPTHTSPSIVRVDVKSADQDSGASWVPTTTKTNGQTAFLYQADYRSNVVSYVTIEITEAGGKVRYESIGRLAPSQTWATYRSRFYVPKNVTAIRAYHVLISAGFQETRNYKLYSLPNKLNAPMISINFDDGWQSFYENGLPLTDKYQVPTTQYIVASYLSDSEKYMTVKEVKALQTKGHEIGAHTLKHCDLTKLSDADLQYDLDTSKQVLEKDFGSVSGFAYPFGSFNTHTTQVLRNQYAYTRTTQPGYNDYYYDPYDIKVQNIHNTTTPEQVQEWVDNAVKNNLWLVLVYHEVEPDGEFAVKPAEFEKQLQIIKASGADVVTMKTAISRIEAAR